LKGDQAKPAGFGALSQQLGRQDHMHADIAGPLETGWITDLGAEGQSRHDHNAGNGGSAL
jgi:hypothetical protein